MASSNKAISNRNSVGQCQARLDHLALVQWITRSDEPALAQFYDATNELLFGLVLHALRDTVIAEDVLSRAYADIKQEAARFDQSQSSLLVWLITIAHWHVYEHLLSSRTSEPLVGLMGRLSGFRERKTRERFRMNRSEHRQLVYEILANLSPAQVQLIELDYFSRMTPVKIALKLGQRLETVKVGLQEGMSQLCRLFKNDFPATELKRRLPRVA